ncbi:MAG: dTDP-4-dehydrorhamnose 3,5-epimerase, partial [Actinomycetota bacterium]|nr:dTDP-4-dehydrorhamnose 3,5-epimerase [Actinomycetota bacterium]
FCVTTEVADVVYRCSTYYDSGLDRGFAYDDPEVAVKWPELELTASERDTRAPLLSEIAEGLPFTS